MKLAPHIFALAVLATACRLDSLGPQQRALRLEGAIGRPTIGVGDTTSLIFRLRNVSRQPVTLTFSSSCQVLPYITARQTDQIVYPGGNWLCLTVVTSLTLAPGTEEVITVLVQGAAPGHANPPGVPLPPGEYLAYARLARSDFDLRSDAVPFTVN